MNVKILPAISAEIRDVLTPTLGATVEIDRSFRGDVVLRLISAPAGRGAPRRKFLIVAADLPLAFQVLAAALETAPSPDVTP